MKQNEQTRRIIKAACKKVGVANVAKRLGFHPGTLSNMISGQAPYEPIGKTRNFVDETRCFIEASETVDVLQYLANCSGYVLVKNPAIGEVATPAITQLSKLISDFAGLLDEFASSNADGKISLMEAEQLRHRWEPIKAHGETFILSAEKGTFK